MYKMINSKQQEFNVYGGVGECNVFYDGKLMLNIITTNDGGDPYYAHQFQFTQISSISSGVENCDESPSFNTYLSHMLDNIPA